MEYLILTVWESQYKILQSFTREFSDVVVTIGGEAGLFPAIKENVWEIYGDRALRERDNEMY